MTRCRRTKQFSKWRRAGDSGTLYNTQLLFDADGTLIQRRPQDLAHPLRAHDLGQGDGSGLRAVFKGGVRRTLTHPAWCADAR